jgi:hypothetical protein
MTAPFTDISPDTTGSPAVERVSNFDHARGAVVTAVATASWVALAVWRPTSTFHFAPLIAAGAWPFLLRRGPLRVAAVDAGRAAAIAGVLVVIVGVGLHLADLLRGPTFWGSGRALVEVPLTAIAGAFAGYRYARCGVPGQPAAGH